MDMIVKPCIKPTFQEWRHCSSYTKLGIHFLLYSKSRPHSDTDMLSSPDHMAQEIIDVLHVCTSFQWHHHFLKAMICHCQHGSGFLAMELNPCPNLSRYSGLTLLFDTSCCHVSAWTQPMYTFESFKTVQSTTLYIKFYTGPQPEGEDSWSLTTIMFRVCVCVSCTVVSRRTEKIPCTWYANP